MDSVISHGDIGQVKVLVSPTFKDFGEATADEIFDLSALTNERFQLGKLIRDITAVFLAAAYAKLSQAEQNKMAQGNFDTGYDVLEQANKAVRAIQFITTEPWRDLVYSDEWRASAIRVIGTQMATIIHIERLLYADAYPDHKEAAAYKARFHK